MNKAQRYDESRLYDVIVVGGGPAGLTASLYLARARYRVLVLEKDQLGGQITITDEVVNYPGLRRVSGKELTETIRQQAEAFGAEFLIAEALSLDADGDVKTVRTSNGDYYCLGILLATGARPRTVGFSGEEKFKGKGVAYCATCDGEFFTVKEIFVVGGGFAAAEESVFLTKFARHVTIMMRGDDFSCAASVAEGAKNHEKISVLTNTVLEEVSGGDGGLTYIRYKNTKTGKITEYRVDDSDSFGVFVFAGYAPNTDMIKGTVELNSQGYIVTEASLQTSVEGVYAAGDVCIKPLRQIVTATGDGALAATELEKYVATLQRRTGISATPPKAKKESAPTPPAPPDDSNGVISSEMKSQLGALFSKMKDRAILRLYLDSRPISRELESYMSSIASSSDMVSLEVADEDAPSDVAPCVRICRADGSETGLAFHGVPGGHEFTSFVLGIYNAIGPGQPLDGETEKRIGSIDRPTDVKILVSLSCTMCPDTVVAAQQIAAKNANVTAEIYDVHHFPELRKRHNVMSVPCIVVNDVAVSFGKKTVAQLLDLIK